MAIELYICIINPQPNILQTPIEYLTGVSAQRVEMLRKELNFHTFKNLLNYNKA